MMTMVAVPMVTRGSWYGVALSPRVTIRRICTSSCMAFGGNGFLDACPQRLAAEADVEIDGLGAVIQPAQVIIEEDQVSSMQADAFPDPVAENESRCPKTEDHGLLAGFEFAVNRDQYIRVAGIIQIFVTAMAHGNGFAARWLN